jgi:hypothetical protein
MDKEKKPPGLALRQGAPYGQCGRTSLSLFLQKINPCDCGKTLITGKGKFKHE